MPKIYLIDSQSSSAPHAVCVRVHGGHEAKAPGLVVRVGAASPGERSELMAVGSFAFDLHDFEFAQ